MRLLLCLLLFLTPHCVYSQTLEGPGASRAIFVGERLLGLETAYDEASERYSAVGDTPIDERAHRAALDRFYREVEQCAAEAIDVARAHPDDEQSLDALLFAIRVARGGPSNQSKRAMEALLQDHVGDPRMGEVCVQVFYLFQWPITEELIRGVLKDNPNRNARGLACYALVRYLDYRAEMIGRLINDPQLRSYYDRQQSVEAVSALVRSRTLDELNREAETVRERILSEFGDVQYDGTSLSKIVEGELTAIRTAKA